MTPVADVAAPSSRGLDDIARLLWPADSGTAASVGWSGRAARASREYLLLPVTGEPTLLVPARPRAAARAAIARASLAPTPRARAARRLAGAAVGAGAAALLRRRLRVAVPAGGRGIEDALAEVVDRAVVVGVYLGRPRANLKPVVQVMDRAGATLAFAKIGMTPLTDDLVAREADALRALAAASHEPTVVPRVLHVGAWQGHPLLVQEALPVWRATAAPADHALAAAMRAVAAVGADRRPLRDCACWDDLRTDLDRLGDDAAYAPLRRAYERLAPLAGTWVTAGVGHGDWTPGNTAVVDGRVMVWDWERYAEHQPAGYDALHYDLQRRLFWDAEPDGVERWTAGSTRLLAGLGVAADAVPLVRASYLASVLARWRADRQRPVADLPQRMERALGDAIDEIEGTHEAGARRARFGESDGAGARRARFGESDEAGARRARPE